jgi:hypothetical protein
VSSDIANIDRVLHECDVVSISVIGYDDLVTAETVAVTTHCVDRRQDRRKLVLPQADLLLAAEAGPPSARKIVMAIRMGVIVLIGLTRIR